MGILVPMLLTAIKEKIVTDMQTNISNNDPTRANVVKIGRFQEDPLGIAVYIAISPGDPERIEWADGIVTLESMQNIGFHIDPREVGGGEVWWRRGVAQLGCFYVRNKYSEEDAALYAYTALHRLENSLVGASISGLRDDYDELAVKLFLAGHQFAESGGPPDSYIWRGKVWWQVLTEKP